MYCSLFESSHKGKPCSAASVSCFLLKKPRRQSQGNIAHICKSTQGSSPNYNLAGSLPNTLTKEALFEPVSLPLWAVRPRRRPLQFFPLWSRVFPLRRENCFYFLDFFSFSLVLARSRFVQHCPLRPRGSRLHREGKGAEGGGEGGETFEEERRPETRSCFLYFVLGCWNAGRPAGGSNPQSRLFWSGGNYTWPKEKEEEEEKRAKNLVFRKCSF